MPQIAAAINTSGLAHSTGFPLYMLVGKIALLLGDNSAQTLNLFSSFLIASSVVILFFMLQTLGINSVVSFLSAFVFGLGKNIWFHSGMVAIYPMSVLFITLLLLIFARWYKNQNKT